MISRLPNRSDALVPKSNYSASANLPVEDFMLGMRRSIGVPVGQVQSVEGAPAVFERLEQLGLVCEQGVASFPRWRGWLLGNEVYGAIWSLVS